MISVPIPTQKQVAALSEAVNMTSLELVDFINEDRKAKAEAAGAAFPSKGHAKLEHADFMKKVVEVLGVVAGNFSGYYTASNGKANPMYTFPKRESCLMAMSYSYELQAKVFDHMTALEQQLQNVALPQAVASQVGGIVKAVVHKELAAMIPELIQAELSKNQTSLRHGETAGQIWKRHGLPPLKNGSRMLSFWLIKHGAFTGGNAEVGGVKSKVFDPDLADKAMREGVVALCWRYVAERQGQMLIEFSHPPLKPVPGEAISLDMGRRLRKQRASNRGKDAA